VRHDRDDKRKRQDQRRSEPFHQRACHRGSVKCERAADHPQLPHGTRTTAVRMRQ
jgi:hypothetical protein